MEEIEMDNMSIEEIEIYRQKLLQAYHAKKEDMDFAEDEMEEGWIEGELEEFRVEIKVCISKIAQLKEENNKKEEVV